MAEERISHFIKDVYNQRIVFIIGLLLTEVNLRDC